jgi:hypothetical protein
MAKSPSNRSMIVPHKSDFDPTKSLLNEFDGDGKPVLFPYKLEKEEIPFDPKTDFHVNFLKNQFTDVARPNQFKVDIIPPDPLLQDWDVAKHGLLALVKTAKIPSITVKEYTYQRAGQKLHIPTGEIEHGEVSITFYNDSDFVLRTMFNRWIRLALHNYEYNIGSVPKLALDGQVVVYHYDYALKPVYAVKLMNAWPKSLSEIDLSHETENTAEEFTVEFNYSYQEIYKTSEEK